MFGKVPGGDLSASRDRPKVENAHRRYLGYKTLVGARKRYTATTHWASGGIGSGKPVTG